MKGPIGCIVLAAGASTRMGQAKQLLQWEGKSLIRRAVETAQASKAKFCVTVLGARSAQIAQEIADLDTQIVYNPCWERGMATSLKAGLLACQQLNPCLKAVLVTLVDQPFVQSHHLNLLIETFQQQKAWIVASQYEEIKGVPALFSREVFPPLLAMRGEAGARKIIRQLDEQVISVPLPEGILDVDTPEDYQKLLAASSRT